jgi:hypothetical protein
MITNNAEALESLRMALAQLHDVNVYYAGTDSESQWCTSVAFDWVRTALHYGEQAVLTETLARYGTGHKDCGPLCPVHGDPRLTNIAPRSATESVTEF